MEHQDTELAAPAKIPLHPEQVAIEIAPERLESFFPMLQRGVTVPAKLGSPLRELLCGQFGIPAQYVEGRITTIFLDNHPVDDLDRSLIREGARVTLSAAMPGLVGATMRRSGFYAALRQGISHAEAAGDVGSGAGSVRLKLFNLLLPELAPLILARGILVPEEDLERLLRDLDPAPPNPFPAPEPCRREPCGSILLRVSVRGVPPAEQGQESRPGM